MKIRRPARQSSTRLSDAVRRAYEAESLEQRYFLTTVLPTTSGTPISIPATTQLLLSGNPIPILARSPGAAIAMGFRPPALSFGSQSVTASPADVPAQAPSFTESNGGALAGKVTFTSGGHGYVWRPAVTNTDGSVTPGYWGIMRSYGYNFMEDMGNQDQIQPYADYLLAAGATVVAERPVGHQTAEVVMDNAMGYSPATGGVQVISGAWSANTVTTPYWSINNGNDSAHWNFAAGSATQTAVIRYTPNIPTAGFYPVYAWTNPGTDDASNDRLSDQTYRINFTGGSYEVKVAQNKVGNGWVYLGSYYFAQGVSGANVEISNKTSGTVAGKYAVADGLRFGNGMGDWTGTGTTVGTHPISGYSHEDECALYWCYDARGWNGNNNRVSTSVVDAGSSGADENLNFFACDRFAAYMNNANVGPTTDRLWISFHSNGSGSAGTGGATRGTLGLINVTPTVNQTWLAETAGYTVQQEMLGAGFNWFAQGDGTESVDNNTVSGGYAEISSSSSYIGDEFDATIIEVAYHDNATDNALLKDPSVRLAVGRAAYHTAVKYFQQYDGLANTTYLPEPPVNLAATTDAAGNVNLTWTPGPSSTGAAGPYGNAATSYIVYTSTNGYGFNASTTVTGTSASLAGLSTTAPTYFKVTALNAGGESLGSYVVVAKPQTSRTAPLLIVNDFHRLDNSSDQLETKSFGTVYRARARYNNSFDYAVQAASSIAAYNPALGIDSADVNDITAGTVNLANYKAVLWMAGKQSSGFGTTFSATAQSRVVAYLNGGGKLFVSGSEVGYDLVSQGHGSAFFTSTLHAAYVSDDANVHTFAAGVAGKALASVAAGAFDDGTHGSYDVSSPDVLGVSADSSVALYYAGTSAAAVQYASPTTAAKTFVLGFPIESVYTPATRNSIIAGVLNFFEATGVPALTVAGDTGTSASDRLTNLNNTPGKSLQFIIPNTVPGALVQLFSDGTLIGQTTAIGSTTTITTNGSTTLANGTHLITAKQQDVGWNLSAASTSITITVDTTAPTASLAAVATPRTTTLSSEAITFSESVAGLTAANFILTRDGGPNLLTPAQTLTGSGTSFTLDNLAALTTSAGTYTLTLTPAGVTDAAGNAIALTPTLTWRNAAITGTPAADAIYLIRNAANPAALDVTVNGNTYTLSLANLGQLSILGAGGSDSVTLDFSNGTPTFDPSAGLTLSAVSSLNLIGSADNDTLSISDTAATINTLPITLTTSPNNLSFAGGTGNDSLTLTNRPITFDADASLTTANLSLNLGSNATATFNATQHLAALNLTGTAAATLTPGGGKVLVTNTLSLAPPSRLDLADNDLAINIPPDPAVIRSYLLHGSLFSSSATPITALGYALASDLGISTFSAQPVTAAALLIKYTYLGDTDLDGRATYDDLARLDRGRAKALDTWLAGDSNYDGLIDATDSTLAYTAFRDQGAALKPIIIAPMHMTRRPFALFALLLTSCATPAPTTKPATDRYASPPFLSPTAIDVLAILPAPPSPTSAERREELALILKLQQNRTPAQAALCRADNDLSIFRFADILGPHFTPANCPLTANFFNQIEIDEGYFNRIAKLHYQRPRPTAEPGVHPVMPQGGFSYPSGHSTRATLFAELLADLLPDKRDALLNRGRDIGFRREIAGVHYPSDVLAGRILGHNIAHALLRSPSARQTLDQLRPELARSLAQP